MLSLIIVISVGLNVYKSVKYGPATLLDFLLGRRYEAPCKLEITNTIINIAKSNCVLVIVHKV